MIAVTYLLLGVTVVNQVETTGLTLARQVVQILDYLCMCHQAVYCCIMQKKAGNLVGLWKRYSKHNVGCKPTAG